MKLTKNIPHFLLATIFSICYTYGQNYKKAYKNLSYNEKCWVVFHLFKAKKAYRTTKAVEKTVDSIAKTKTIGNDKNGGNLDAFKHCYWMFTLAQEIGYRSARSLGKAHEKGNYKQFKKGKMEDEILPDSIASEMDRFNNNSGITLYKQHKDANKEERISLILKEIELGNLRIIKKDNAKNYLSCDNTVINLRKHRKKWNIPKCLIPSN